MIKDLSVNEKQANNRTSDKQDQNKNFDINKQMSLQSNSKMNSNLLINTYLNQSDN
jgi:hypothetical protein